MKSLFRGASAPMTAVSALMLVLLAVLAVLQYRWTGQLGIAEREQMLANVQSAVARYADDFDRELTRAWVYFLPSPSEGKSSDDAVIQRYDHWVDNAPYPELIRDVYVLRNVGRQNDADATDTPPAPPKLRQLNTASRSFDEVAWQDAFEMTPEELVQRRSRRRDRPIEFAPTRDEALALIVPLDGRVLGARRGARGRTTSFAVLKLDEAFITETLLPTLTQRHFADGDYRLEVRRSSDDAVQPSLANVLYQSPANATPTAKSDTVPDAEAPLFGLLPGREFPPLLAEAGHSTREFAALNRRSTETRRRPPEPPGARGSSDRAWMLSATHRSGSLAQAIQAARIRNLSISFGILVLLAGSVAMILVSARRAQELARQKMEFVAGVSHELRTPLTVICSAGQNLADGVTDDPGRVRDYGQLIHDEGRRLSEMVSNVLEHAAVQSGRKTYGQQRLRVADVVEAAVSDCQTLLDDGNFQLERDYADGVPQVEGDPEALRRAVQNLIVNAVKYADDQPWIGLRIASTTDRGKQAVSITVRDKGRGIEPSERGQIFEPFVRGAAAVADEIHGNGLGLSLVRQIVSAHGGRVELESSTTAGSSGSAFTVHLPPASPAAEASADAAATDGHPARG